MKERIILAPGLNGNELIKNLALNGINSFGTRIIGAGELARIALLQSGVTIAEEFIDPNEQVVIVAEAVKDIEYFKNPSFADLSNIASAIDRMRNLVASHDETSVISDALSQGIFMDKNNALLVVYKRYMQILKDRNAIDSVLLIRKAIAESTVMNAEFFELDEYGLSPLQNELLKKVSGNKVSYVSLCSLFNKPEKPIKISDYKNCYGASNEVETILADIYSGKNVDECIVAVTDPATYAQLFFDYAVLYDIPMTFGCGISIMNSNPAKLLNLYYNWMTNGFYGTEAIKAMFHSDAFDIGKLRSVLPEVPEGFSWSTFYDVLGQLKYTTDSKSNKVKFERYLKALSEDEALVDKSDERAYKSIKLQKMCIPFIETMSHEFELSTIDFISKYSFMRIGDKTSAKALLTRLDFDALNEIREQMLLIDKVDIEMTNDELILAILKSNVFFQQSAPGKLHVTSIDKAVTSVRKNTYIAGLSASNYPGSPKENYLLLDDDLRLFGHDGERYTSSGRIKTKRDRLFELVKLSSRLGSYIHISYSGLNVSELKSENASSLIYELFKEEHGSTVTSKQLEDSIKKIAYFEPGISVGRFIGKEYVDGNFISPYYHKRSRDWPDQVPEKKYSPSALESYLECPRKFFLQSELYIPAPDEDEPFAVITSKDEGIMAHSLMELLADDPDISREKFLEKAGEYFDRYIDEHTQLISKNVEYKKSQFIEMMENAYNTNPKREVVLKEEDISYKLDSGVVLHGYPDRVEKLEDESVVIVDYKTGSYLKHKKDDPYSCLQVLVYAYLMSMAGYKISHCEYRYIKLGQIVTCAWDENTQDGLNEILNSFIEDMRLGRFECNIVTEEDVSAGADDPCKFCKYGSVCGKEICND